MAQTFNKIVLLGWGANSSVLTGNTWEFTNPGKLMEKQMTIVTNKDCQDFWVRYCYDKY